MHRAYIAKIVARLRLLQPAKTSTAPVTCTYCSQQNGESPDFDPNRVLVLSKTTRYEFEKRRFPDLNDDQLQRLLSKRGSDYGKIYRIHNVHKRNIEKITDTLEKRKLEYKVVSRNDFTIEEVKKSDAVIAAGGDGTFLLAASKVFDDTPVIGVNTDAKRSEGFLALPNKCTVNFEDTLSKLLTGKFKWTWRQRIRVTVEGGHVNTEPVDLHEEIIGYPEHYDRHHNPKDDSIQDLSPRVLPVFALNEVFVGESLASRVSYYEVGINDGPIEKQKSSGLTVSTGSGSTSWSFNINKLSDQSVTDIIRIASTEIGRQLPLDERLVKTVTKKFNRSLVYAPDDVHMVYTIRDPVVNGIYSVKSPRGFAKKIVVKSRMWDACLVMDSGASFVFNDGATATMEIDPKIALRTVTLLDS